jgi:hypothetical protein
VSTIPPADPETPVTVTRLEDGIIATSASNILTIAQQVDAAIATVPTDKRGCFLVRADRVAGTAALMIRAGDNVAFVARIVKPYAGAWEGDASLRVTFLVAGASVKPLTVADYYRILRQPSTESRNGRTRAFIKAVGVRYLNLRPYLDGSKWWEDGKAW